jgi:integrase
MQQGSIIQTVRKQGPNVWSFRWSEKNRNGRRVYRKRVIGMVPSEQRTLLYRCI